MRAKDFLLEYNQSITVQKMGAALAQAIQKDPTAQKMAYRAAMATNNPELQNDAEFLSKLALTEIEKADPTPNKQYVTWLARVYANSWNKPTSATGTGMWIEDVISTIAQYLQKYHELNKRKMLPRPANDINSFRDFNTFMYDVDQYQLPEKEEEVNKGQVATLYDDADFRVLIPKDQAAACYYGRGTRWCTAATKNNMFAHYETIAPLIIVLPKHPEHNGEKYQLHFGVSISDGFTDFPVYSDTDVDDIMDNHFSDDDGDGISPEDWMQYGQFMDESDDPVELYKLQERMGESWGSMIHAYMDAFPGRKWQLLKNID